MTQSGTGLALCLAGGGVSGAFYEFGAVAALEAGIDGWTVAQAPVVVGTSCGSIVGSFLALGIAATEPLTAARTGPKHPLWLNTRDVYRLPLDRHARGWVKALAGLPDSIRGREKGRRDSWLDVVFDMHRKLPSGVFTNEGIARVIGKAARWSGRDGSFAALDMPLRITATDLNEASRAVFGHGHVMDVPVGLAACASTCIPYYMEPVRILGRDYIDGQIWNPIHLDLGVVPATRAVLAVTPLSAYRQTRLEATSQAGDEGRLGRAGAAVVLDQSARIAAKVKDEASRAAFRAAHPDIPVFFVEPEPDTVFDLMTAVLRPGNFARYWEIGFRTAARRLLGSRDEAGTVLGALGMGLDVDGLRSAADHWDVSLVS